MTTYFIFMYVVSLALAYSLAFTEATFEMGKSLSESDIPGEGDTPRGYQDAITPPLLANFGIAVSVISMGGLVYGFWRFGWITGLGTILAFVFVSVLNKAIILPNSKSEHFRKLIFRSLINRYADYVRDGDTLRTLAVGMLLDRLGLPISELANLLKKGGST